MSHKERPAYLKALESEADRYFAYENLCELAGVGIFCSHGFRWDRCLDGCRISDDRGLKHFERKTGEKRFIC